MHARRPDLRVTPWAALALALAVGAGCGGSGSSGFEPSLSEGRQIRTALEEQRCVEESGFTICPSGATVPGHSSGSPSIGDLRIDATVDPGPQGGCGDASGVGDCQLTVVIDAAGLSGDLELRLAYRLLPEGAWRIGPPLDPRSSSDGGPLAPVTLDLAEDARRSRAEAAQVAVLAFSPPPGSLPEEVETLASTGAGFAFVVPPVSIATP